MIKFYMKILITGSTGQLGQTFKYNVPEGIELIRTTKNNFNLLDNEQCFKKILEIKPKWILNFAAYTNVDSAEKEKEIAFQANGKVLDSISKAIIITGLKYCILVLILYLMKYRITHTTLSK